MPRPKMIEPKFKVGDKVFIPPEKYMKKGASGNGEVTDISCITGKPMYFVRLERSGVKLLFSESELRKRN